MMSFGSATPKFWVVLSHSESFCFKSTVPGSLRVVEKSFSALWASEWSFARGLLAFVSAVLSRYRFPPALYSHKWDPETDVTARAERKIDWILRNYLSSFSRRWNDCHLFVKKATGLFHFYFSPELGPRIPPQMLFETGRSHAQWYPLPNFMNHVK